MCEVGAWKDFDDIEDCLTLDELSMLYEMTGERQSRIMKMLGAQTGMSGGVGNIDANYNDVIDQPLNTPDGESLFGYVQTQGE